jgi:four helix bundle protein
MKYARFEDLPVWQAAIQLARSIYTFTKAHHLSFSFRDQLERATLSISNNIAEGFERGTTQELLTFLYIARGSAGEVRSMLCLLTSMSEYREFETEIAALKSKAEMISRQLRGWANALQNSKIKGTRYLTDTVRRDTEAEKQREAFLEEINRIATQGHAEREARRKDPQ